jgi:hypothetical protein
MLVGLSRARAPYGMYADVSFGGQEGGVNC